jgi:hypothetical protein
MSAPGPDIEPAGLPDWLDERQRHIDATGRGPVPYPEDAALTDASRSVPVLLAMVRAALAVRPLADPSFPAGAGERNALAEVRRVLANVLAETGEQAHG